MLKVLFFWHLLLTGFVQGLNKDARFSDSFRKTAGIMKQAELCSYISLCTLSNSSFYRKPKYGSAVPCCQDCSCEDTCVTNGTCCPDFNDEDSESNTNFPTTPQLPLIWPGEKKVCVKTTYGNLANAEGYLMIAECPDNFKDEVIKFYCESEFEILSKEPLRNHIPVSDTVTGLTYKNHYCELCNRDQNYSTIPWDVSLECGATGFHFPYYQVRNSFELATETISRLKRPCNIVFHFNIVKDNFTELQFCKKNSIIDTCIAEYQGSDIEKLCMSYSWPIKVTSGVITYKNYHCMVCNGQEFQETCLSPVKADFRILLMTDSVDDTHMNAMFIDETITTAETNRGQIIGRVFPNEAGHVHCPKGFIYDQRKDRCRHVLCPLYFFLENGKCVPMFRLINGIFYTVLLKLPVPDSLKHAQQEDFEISVSSSIYSYLSDPLGETGFKFYLWSSQTLPGTVNTSKPYLISLAIEGNVLDGSYASFLEFVDKFVFCVKKINISLKNGEVKEENIHLHFSSSTYWKDMKPYSREKYRLIYSSTEDIGGRGFEDVTEVSILESSLCYRTPLFDDEFQLKVNHIRIFETKAFLYAPPISVATENGEKKVITCLNKVFNQIPDSSNNVFSDENTTGYIYVSRSEVNIQRTDHTKANNANSNVDTDNLVETSLKRSIVATLSTICLLVFLIGIRCILRKLHKKHEQSGSVECFPRYGDGTLQEMQNEDELVVISQFENKFAPLTKLKSAKDIYRADKNMSTSKHALHQRTGKREYFAKFKSTSDGELSVKISCAGINESAAYFQSACNDKPIASDHESAAEMQSASNVVSAEEIESNGECTARVTYAKNKISATGFLSKSNCYSAAGIQFVSSDKYSVQEQSASGYNTSAAEIQYACTDESTANIQAKGVEKYAAKIQSASNDKLAARVQSASIGKSAEGETSAAGVQSAMNDKPSEGKQSTSNEIPAAGVQSAMNDTPVEGNQFASNDKPVAGVQSAMNGTPAEGKQFTSNYKPAAGVQSAMNDKPSEGKQSTSNDKPAGGVQSAMNDKPSEGKKSTSNEIPAAGEQSAMNDTPAEGKQSKNNEIPAAGVQSAMNDTPAEGNQFASKDKHVAGVQSASNDRPVAGVQSANNDKPAARV